MNGGSAGSPNTTNSSAAEWTCVAFPEQPHRCTVIQTVWQWVSILSLIGSLFVILLILRLDKHKQCLPQRLILSLSVGALVLSLSGVLSDSSVQHQTTQCFVQGFLLQFGVWAVLVWVSCISFNVCWNVVHEVRTGRRLEIAYHAVAWTLSAAMSCIPILFSREVYGPTGGWCWITGRFRLLRFVTFYIPLYVILAVILIIYIAILLSYSRRVRRWEGSYNPEQERIKEQNRQAARGLLVYPLVYVLLSIFPFANRIYQAVHGEGSAVFALVILHALSAPMMGFANAVVYAWDAETSRRVREVLKLRQRVFGRRIPLIMDYHAEVTSSTNTLLRSNTTEEDDCPYIQVTT